MADRRTIKVDAIQSVAGDGSGNIAIDVKTTSGREIRLVLKDERLELLIAFLTAAYAESLSLRAAESKPRAFGISGFQVGSIDEAPVIRIDTFDGIPFHFAMHPGGDFHKIQALVQALWSEMTGGEGSFEGPGLRPNQQMTPRLR